MKQASQYFQNPVLKYLSQANPIKRRQRTAKHPIRSIYSYQLLQPPAVSSNSPISPTVSGLSLPKDFQLQYFKDFFKAGNIVYSRFQSTCNDDNGTVGQVLIDGKQIEYSKSIDQSQKIKITPQTQYQLSFQSRFQSGNLFMAAKEGDDVYNLLLQKDINTAGHTQWFFFKVQSKITKQYQLRILNFSKKQSLHIKGMQPVIYSSKHNSWKRAGFKISYGPTSFLHSKGKYYYLSFRYNFQIGEQIYFAYSYPYTYTHLKNKIRKWQKQHNKLLHVHNYTYTLCGNSCYQLIIQAQPQKKKPVIFILSRVHSGQSVSSFVCQGIIEFLLGNTPQAQLLRHSYCFNIIPMINVDGVIHGNYRASLSGKDLNRTWLNPSKKYHPEVYFLKQIISDIHSQRRVVSLIDLHGHSLKKDCFLYGCQVPQRYSKSRQFAYLLSKISPYVNYSNCSFNIQKDKQSTARVVCYRQLSHPYVYTLQSSFLGGSKTKQQYAPKNYMQVGQHLCKTMLLYFGYQKTVKSPYSEQKISSFIELKQALTEFKIKPQLNRGILKKSQGSQSNPSEDDLDMEQLIVLLEESKKKRRTILPQQVSACQSVIYSSVQTKPKIRKPIRSSLNIPSYISSKPQQIQNKQKQQRGRYLSQLMQQACSLNYTSVIFPSVLLKQYHTKRKRTKMYDFNKMLSSMNYINKKSRFH